MIFRNSRFFGNPKTVTVSVTMIADDLAGDRRNLKSAALALGYLANTLSVGTNEHEFTHPWIKEITIQ